MAISTANGFAWNGSSAFGTWNASIRSSSCRPRCNTIVPGHWPHCAGASHLSAACYTHESLTDDVLLNPISPASHRPVGRGVGVLPVPSQADHQGTRPQRGYARRGSDPG